MAQAVSPSETTPVTAGQIAKLWDLFSAGMRKSGLPGGCVQQVIEDQGGSIAAEMVALVRKRVEAMSGMIIRRVKVNRSESPQEMLDATGRKQHIDRKAVNAMPRGEGEEVDVYFFKPDPSAYKDGFITCAEADRQYEMRGFKPDLYAQGAVNKADPAFADEHPNGSQWKEKDGNYCYATFGRWRGERDVDVDRSVNVWHDNWWFAGVRKQRSKLVT